MITLSDEIQVAWKGRWTVTKLLLLTIRWTMVGYALLSFVLLKTEVCIIYVLMREHYGAHIGCTEVTLSAMSPKHKLMHLCDNELALEPPPILSSAGMQQSASIQVQNSEVKSLHWDEHKLDAKVSTYLMKQW